MSKHILIYRATGGAGREVMAQALAKGRRVTAFVRSLDKVGLKSEALTVVQGDALNYDDVKSAVADQDAAGLNP